MYNIDMKNLTIINSENKKLITSIIKHFEGDNITIAESANNLPKDCDLVILTGFTTDILPENIPCKVINIHPSLLPAFKEVDALKQSFVSGVKVSGITVHYVENDNFFGKIIAQYPVLIGNGTHYDEFCKEMNILCEKIYPKVIEAVLEDKVFDFDELYQNSCYNNCNGGCSGNCNTCNSH